MKARMENGVIVMYETLPKNYSSQTLGVPIVDFSTMSEEIHQSEGFFDVVTPEPDFYTQKLGEIYKDEEKKVCTTSIGFKSKPNCSYFLMLKLYRVDDLLNTSKSQRL